MTRQSHGLRDFTPGSLNRSANKKRIARSEFRIVKGVECHEVGTPTHAGTTLVHTGRSTDRVARTEAVPTGFSERAMTERTHRGRGTVPKMSAAESRFPPNEPTEAGDRVPKVSAPERRFPPNEPTEAGRRVPKMSAAKRRFPPNEPTETLQNSPQLTMNQRLSIDQANFARRRLPRSAEM